MRRSRSLFLTLLLALGLQRLWELRKSRRHVEALLRRGGREHAAEHYPLIKLLHISWFVAMVTEVLVKRRRFRPRLALAAGSLLLLGQSLRYAAIRTLGPRWTTRVVTLPDAPPVSEGIYRYLSHPNYAGVVLEIGAVPLLHSAWWTALLFSLANLLLLRMRIRVEEEALKASQSTER